jgi:signal transduction histidine kinase
MLSDTGTISSSATIFHPRWFLSSVRGRLTLLVVALLAPALLLVAALIYRAFQNEREAVAAKLLSSARAVAGLADRELKEFATILRTLGASQALADGDLRSFDVIARSALADDKRWIALSDELHHQLINTLRPYGAVLPPMAAPPEMRSALDGGSVYISNLVEDPVADGPVLSVSRPVVVEGRRHVLTLFVRPAELAEILGLPRFTTPDGRVSLIDRDHRILARSSQPETYLGRTANSHMQALVGAASEGVHNTVTLDGLPVLCAFHRAEKSGWVAVVSAPRASLFASARKLLWVGLALSALLLATAGILAAWVMRGLTRGIDSLVAGSESIIRGEPVDFVQSGLRETDFVGLAMVRSARHLQETSGQLRTTLNDLRIAEEVLRSQNEGLEKRVAERTHRLRETIGELEAFSYSISHDMRAPLRAMHSYAQLLQTEHAAGLDPEARRYLERINVNAARLELLVRDVLAYSRVAKEQIETKPVDLDRFVRELVSHASGIEVGQGAIEVRGTLPPVLAHQAYLSQILTNLVGNAFKFVAPGVTPRVEISGEERNGLVKISVRDNGIGIDPADFDRIFQIFGRVHHADAYDGTGIGLAIVNKAVQRMGGELGVDSAVGGGSTFWFTLPRA